MVSIYFFYDSKMQQLYSIESVDTNIINHNINRRMLSERCRGQVKLLRQLPLAPANGIYYAMC